MTTTSPTAEVAELAATINQRTGLDLGDDELGRMIGEIARDSLSDEQRDLIALAREDVSLDRRPSVRAHEDPHNDLIRAARRRCDELGLDWDILKGVAP